MDVQRLRSFVKLAECLSFSRAAEALNVSQPALSHQIRVLEEELDIRLFERTKRRVMLTNAGAAYLEGVRGVLQLLETSAERARDAHFGLGGHLSVAAIGVAMIQPLPAVVRAFRRRYPGRRISLSVLRHPDPFDAVRANSAQLAFAAEAPSAGDLEHEFLWSFPFRVILSADHPLARRDEVCLHDLGGETLITPPQRGGLAGGDEALAVCRELAFTPASVREVPEVADVEAIMGLVASGLGFGILPVSYEAFSLPSTVFRPIAGSSRLVRIAAFWRPTVANPLVADFLRLARRTRPSFRP